MARKLYYFDVKGYGEGIRYLLHYGGLEFEDVRFQREEYPKIKEEINPPFGKVPVYIEGDRKLHQSQVIAKYIARQIDLVPSDPWEEAQIDAVLQTLQDAAPEVRAAFMEQDPEKKEILIKKLVEETLDYYYTRFDKQLEENKGHFAKKLYWVDIVFTSLVENMQDFFGMNIDKYKHIKALRDEVRNLKGIKEYIANRK